MQKREGFLKVVHVENGTDKSGIKYKVIQFTGIELVGKREVPMKGTATRTMWPQSYTRLVNGVESVFKGDPEFNTIAVGDTFLGHVFFTETTPYQINGGNWINSWKGVVFQGENELNVAARALRQNNAAPMTIDLETGERIKYILQTVAGPTGNTSPDGSKLPAQPELKDELETTPA